MCCTCIRKSLTRIVNQSFFSLTLLPSIGLGRGLLTFDIGSELLRLALNLQQPESLSFI